MLFHGIFNSFYSNFSINLIDNNNCQYVICCVRLIDREDS